MVHQKYNHLTHQSVNDAAKIVSTKENLLLNAIENENFKYHIRNKC